LAVRPALQQVLASVETPAHELELLALLLKRLERETFTSPTLARLRRTLQADGKPASQHIHQLTRLVHHFDSARNQFFRVIAAPLIWMPQFAMAIEAWRIRCGPHIGEWMAAVGEFEALCSLASFAYERPSAVFPDLIASLPGAAEPHLEATGLAHPLIPPAEAVANDVALGGNMRLWIISGSNMSGKSTFLRAIGLNTVLAWAGAPVTAASMRLSRFDIGASLRTNDSLSDHRSRFYAEISRLREIVDLARAGKPTLFLLDELLSGTNSHDRRIGAEGLIRSLVERGAIGLVTTHDLALAEIVSSFGGRAANVHFEDHLEGGEIRFDYRLRQGVVTRSNALELMRAVGLEV
jgi:DNA mismatch repair ATPase MutS